jgi:hypothetical protein
VAVHESQESWETFRDTILFPALSSEIEGGFALPPEDRWIDIRNLQP